MTPMTEPVPATTAIKRSRVGNIDNDRLTRRAEHLGTTVLTPPGGRAIESRTEYAARAAELVAVEDELEARGTTHQRRTLPPAKRGQVVVNVNP
jgi:hypothetical protein